MGKSDSDTFFGEDKLNFAIEGRVLRELGERLVKQPEVALLELVKNAYDADATVCEVHCELPERIRIIDNGRGMTFTEFKNGWMRIGTSAKESDRYTPRFHRQITGEKGIGRFAVRFLGRSLRLTTVAVDPVRKCRTRLVATFDWHVFDRGEDLGLVFVPFRLDHASDDEQIGTILEITDLHPYPINLDPVRTASLAVIGPYHTLMKTLVQKSDAPKADSWELDPGFSVETFPVPEDGDNADVARSVLDSYVLRARVTLRNNRLRIKVYRRGLEEPVMDINDGYQSDIGLIRADIRFFPQRKGTFTGLSVDGRRAKTWVKEHSGVAIFDRAFRVRPYGLEGDDWLRLSADTAKRHRVPRSTIAQKHFPMDEPTRASTQLNFMLRLPYPEQLVGMIYVEGRRTQDGGTGEGLVAAADREGFVDNKVFHDLWDIARGAVEAIAAADRELQQDLARLAQEEALGRLKTETQNAIREIENNPNIVRAEKARIIGYIAQTQKLAEQHEEQAKAKEAALEVMSLLGVVAGYMTHEFGSAIRELEKAQGELKRVARSHKAFLDAVDGIQTSLTNLREFVTYSQGYIHGAITQPARPYGARTRLQRMARIFGKYAAERTIDVRVEADGDVVAPMVPASLYDGIALNLYTNALKAVTAKAGKGERAIVFRAWNERDRHFLEVSDTGIGIPVTLRDRVFEPLFTTTASNRDPLGSGMGLGLSLVKRGVESYGGRISVVDAPAGFTTCVRVGMPLRGNTP